jgi:GNAT superfamily N-acetyltransferase
VTGLKVSVATSSLDIEQVRDLRRSVLCGEMNWSREWVEDPSDAKAVLALASVGQKPVASARLAERDGKFYVEVLAVLERFRRQGIGRRLMSTLEQWTQERKGSGLSVLAPSSIAPFFEHLGYQAVVSAQDLVTLEKWFH